MRNAYVRLLFTSAVSESDRVRVAKNIFHGGICLFY